MLTMRWLFLTLVLVACEVQPQPQDAPPEKASEQAAKRGTSKRIGTKERPLVITIDPNEADKKETERRKEEATEKIESDRDLVYWTRVLAALALFQFIALVIQACIFRTQAKRFKETIESQERSERAYIFPEIHYDQKFIGTSSDIGHVDASINFWNYGKTPAVISLIRGYLTIQKETPQELIDIPESQLPPSLGIPMNVAHQIDVTTKMTREEDGEVDRWEKRVFCVGKIEYLDVNGEPHKTGFCWHLLIHGSSDPHFVPTKDSKLNKRT